MKKILLMIAGWLYRHVKIDKKKVIIYLDIIDADQDGYITLAEIARMLNSLITKVNKWR